MVFAAEEKLVRPQLQPKEIIEHTFRVFCGQQQTMDEVGFARFCESCKNVSANDASIVFATVVHNANNKGMNLTEFKAALALLVSFGKQSGEENSSIETPAKTPTRSVNATKASRPGQILSPRGVLCERNRKESETDFEKPASTFRWPPPAVSETEVSVPRRAKPLARRGSRTIRWCPAEMEEE
jgi:hypothetical protein